MPPPVISHYTANQFEVSDNLKQVETFKVCPSNHRLISFIIGLGSYQNIFILVISGQVRNLMVSGCFSPFAARNYVSSTFYERDAAVTVKNSPLVLDLFEYGERLRETAREFLL